MPEAQSTTLSGYYTRAQYLQNYARRSAADNMMQVGLHNVKNVVAEVIPGVLGLVNVD